MGADSLSWYIEGEIIMKVHNSIHEIKAEVAEWRQQIHTHPELCFEEVKTSQLVQDKYDYFYRL